jgi:hypothetical protein
MWQSITGAISGAASLVTDFATNLTSSNKRKAPSEDEAVPSQQQRPQEQQLSQPQRAKRRKVERAQFALADVGKSPEFNQSEKATLDAARASLPGGIRAPALGPSPAIFPGASTPAAAPLSVPPKQKTAGSDWGVSPIPDTLSSSVMMSGVRAAPHSQIRSRSNQQPRNNYR